MTEQQEAAMRQALKKAFNLGQTYWQQADSEYPSHWKKADVTKASFETLVEDTITALTAALEQPAPVPEAHKQEPDDHPPHRDCDCTECTEYFSEPISQSLPAQQEPVAYEIRFGDCSPAPSKPPTASRGTHEH